MIARTITLDGGKYAVTNYDGILTAKRHGEEWPAADRALLGDKLSLAMVQRIEDLEDRQAAFVRMLEKLGKALQTPEGEKILQGLLGGIK